MGITRQSGEFTNSVITVNLADKLEDSTVEVEIDTNSLSSGFAALDEHLKSADFFDVETYPTATFKSTSIEMTGEQGQAGYLLLSGFCYNYYIYSEQRTTLLPV